MKIDLSNILKEHFSEVFFDRDEFLLRAGDKEEYLYYLDTGIVRLFYDDSKTDMERTLNFFFPRQFVCGYESFKKSLPSNVNIQAIEKVKAYRIHREKFFSLLDNDKTYMSVATDILNELFINRINKEMFRLSLSPEEKYKYLLKNEPHIIQTIPLKYIASYIGITPQALSRIRKHFLTWVHCTLFLFVLPFPKFF